MMAEFHQSIKSSSIYLSFSIILNLLTVFLYLYGGGRRVVVHDELPQQSSWTKNAAEQAEAVASISCSSHGRAFLDGSLGSDGKPVCECNACFTGPDCSEVVPACLVDADSGDPMFLEPFWLQNAESSTIVLPGWHRMSYEFSDGSLVSRELEAQIRRLHEVTGNAVTEGRFIIFGAGATQLLHAAVHALSSNYHHHHHHPSPSRVVASVPYYPVYKEQTEFFNSEEYKFNGDSTDFLMNKKKLYDSEQGLIEFVTSPNNPDGELKKAVLQGPNVKTIHDLAYYWPHFTAIPAPADEDLMIFTLSKLTGHGGSRFGWAIIKDEEVYKRMLTYMGMSVYGVARETQLRALKLLKVVLEKGEGRGLFDFGYKTMRDRWRKISKTLSKSTRFSIQELAPQHCSFFQKLRRPSPAFAWVKCEREEDEDCNAVLMKAVNVTGRDGRLFGAESRYVRLSLVKSQDDFDLLFRRMEILVSTEENMERESQMLISAVNGNSSSTNASTPWDAANIQIHGYQESLYRMFMGGDNITAAPSI